MSIATTEPVIIPLEDAIGKIISFNVVRWSIDPFSKGSWSQLVVGGTPEDRRRLGQPVGDSLIFAGEACNPIQPAQVHGAFESGVSAAQWVLNEAVPTDNLNTDEIVVGTLYYLYIYK